MTIGSWNYPMTESWVNEEGSWRTIGVFSNFRSWNGADCYPPSVGRVSAVDRRILKWSILASSLAYATSKEARRLIREYDRVNGSKRSAPVGIKPSARDGRRSLHAKGVLSDSLLIRDGLSSNSRPVKRARFPTDNAYTLRRDYERHAVMAYNKYNTPWSFSESSNNLQIRDHNAVVLLDDNDQLRLVNKLKERLQGSDFNMSVLLGEGNQSLKMIGDTAIKLAHAGHLVRRGDLKGAASVLLAGTGKRPKNRTARVSSNVASNWLELQYGWLPLLNDAAEGAKTLAHHINVPLRSTYRVKVQRKRTDVATMLGTNGDIVNTIKRSHERFLTARISEFDNSVPALLGLKNPELVAWELLPFSFVVDWFLPIGSYLEARALSSRLTGKFITGDKYKSYSGPPVSGQFGPGSMSIKTHYTEYTRGAASSSLNVPMPRVKSLAQAASWQHCVNGLALLTQVFTGSKVWSK